MKTTGDPFSKTTKPIGEPNEDSTQTKAYLGGLVPRQQHRSQRSHIQCQWQLCPGCCCACASGGQPLLRASLTPAAPLVRFVQGLADVIQRGAVLAAAASGCGAALWWRACMCVHRARAMNAPLSVPVVTYTPTS